MKLLFFSLLLLPVVCPAQIKAGTDVTHITKLNFLDPGMGYEARAGKMQTVYLQAFMNTTAYYSWSSTFGSNGGISFDPAAAVQYRYYYNAARREAKGKRTAMNSLNYVGALLQTVLTRSAADDGQLTETDRRPVTSTGLLWGMQRNGPKRFSLDLNLGIGYLFARGTAYNGDYTNETHRVQVARFTPLGQLNLGFWINKR